jgi:hypothetical protein
MRNSVIKVVAACFVFLSTSDVGQVLTVGGVIAGASAVQDKLNSVFGYAGADGRSSTVQTEPLTGH